MIFRNEYTAVSWRRGKRPNTANTATTQSTFEVISSLEITREKCSESWLFICPKKDRSVFFVCQSLETKMLKFYYHPLSPIARRVWLALLEKEIPFEPILVNLKDRENLKPEFLALNPFHHVPVLVNDEFRLLESFAILDYLETQHPTPALIPETATELAHMRMVQMVTANEFMPKLPAIVTVNTSENSDQAALQHIRTVLQFLAEQLGQRTYFGGEQISLADITVGAALPLTTRLGLDLQAYPSLAAWCDRVMARPAWQQTEPGAEALNAWQRWISIMVKRRRRQLARAQ
ncbi:MAG: glutathione S-transferase family protein [Cyanobacteria bacterium P01_F01_bin.86]